MLAIIDATDAMGTTWNSWETNWTGIETSETSVINTLGHTRGGQATATNVHNNASDIVTTTTTTELRQTRNGYRNNSYTFYTHNQFGGSCS